MSKNHTLLVFLFSLFFTLNASADYIDGQRAYASGDYGLAILGSRDSQSPDFWPTVRAPLQVFKSGLKSREGYDGTRKVFWNKEAQSKAKIDIVFFLHWSTFLSKNF